MAATQTFTRLSPVNISTKQPSYCALNKTVPQEFKCHRNGFGNRHSYDDAPFTLWDDMKKTFRNPTREEVLWIRQRYNATSIDLAFPHMCVKTPEPPHPIPCTVAAALVRFAPPDSVVALTPVIHFQPFGDKKRDVLGTKLPVFSFPEPAVCTEILRKLAAEVKMRAVHFLPPLIIVELRAGSVYQRHSLPGRAGEINIVYHDSPTAYWAGTEQMSYSRLLEPSNLVQDNSDYLYADPKTLSPGICLASATLDNSDPLTNTWRTTTAGIMLQRGSDRLMTVANHGFSRSDEVYHPTPLGRRIGQIVERLPELNIGLVSLDPSISFTNTRYFLAPAPLRMVSHDEIQAGDYYEVDGISTGRLDFVAVGKSYYFEDPTPASVEYECIDVQGWKIELTYSAFGPTGQRARDDVCGAPMVNQEGRVAGFFRPSDASSLFAHTPALDTLIRQGWSVV